MEDKRSSERFSDDLFHYEELSTDFVEVLGKCHVYTTGKSANRVV